MPHLPGKLTNTTLPSRNSSLLSVLRLRDFRLLWIGECVSLLGSQFYLIALPWLVLQLTGDSLAVGTVLAAAGIPRALFMIVGGTVSDRFSPRTVMIASNLVRLSIVSLLAVLVFTEAIQLWMLYLFGLMFGLADAFFFPAQLAIVPALVSRSQLQAANSLKVSATQLSFLLGPALAGGIISLFASAPLSGEQTAPAMQGIGIVLGLNALTFLFSLTMLSIIRLRPTPERKTGPTGMWSAILDGLRYVWRDPALRLFCMAIAGVSFLFHGPFNVGIPLLANTRLAEGAAAYGIVMSAFGAGSLVGVVLSATLPHPALERTGRFAMFLMAAQGIIMVTLGFATTTPFTALVTLLLGIGNGYNNIALTTWIQSRSHPSMLGRTMGLVMFASTGLQPVSSALAGAVIKLDMTALFLTAGLLLFTLSLSFAFRPAFRAVKPAGDESEAVGIVPDVSAT